MSTAAFWKMQIAHSGGKLINSGIPENLKRMNRWIVAIWVGTTKLNSQISRKLRNEFVELMEVDGWEVTLQDHPSKKTYGLLAKREYTGGFIKPGSLSKGGW